MCPEKLEKQVFIFVKIMDEPREQFSLANKNRKIENGTDWKELQECMFCSNLIE